MTEKPDKRKPDYNIATLNKETGERGPIGGGFSGGGGDFGGGGASGDF